VTDYSNNLFVNLELYNWSLRR